MATRTHSDRIWKVRFAVWSYTQFAEEQLPTTTTVKDVLRLPRTSADYCRLFCQVNHNEQALLTWIVNRWPVGRVKLLQEQQLSLEDKLHYHANNNEPMDCFTITPPHCLFKCWCFLVWERDNAVQVRMFFQIHPIRSENAVPSHYFFLTFMLHCKLFCIHTSINFVYLHLSSIPTAWQNKVNK